MAKILVVEDTDSVRTVIRRALERVGHDVTEAGNGRVALGLLKEGGNFDLVLTDIQMNDMNGDELHRHGARLCPRWLAMTGEGAEGVKYFSQLHPPVTVLHKPLGVADWQEAVRKALSS